MHPHPTVKSRQAGGEQGRRRLPATRDGSSGGGVPHGLEPALRRAPRRRRRASRSGSPSPLSGRDARRAGCWRLTVWSRASGEDERLAWSARTSAASDPLASSSSSCPHCSPSSPNRLCAGRRVLTDWVHACVRGCMPWPACLQANMGRGWARLMRPGVSEAARASAARHAVVADYADSVLLQSPMPDFSMPYNVITLTCTVLALFFGRSRPQPAPTCSCLPLPVVRAPTPRSRGYACEPTTASSISSQETSGPSQNATTQTKSPCSSLARRGTRRQGVKASWPWKRKRQTTSNAAVA